MNLFRIKGVWGSRTLSIAIWFSILATMACGAEAGSRLVFVSAVDGDPEIVVVDTQSGEISPITHNNALDLEPRWSPGGKKIAYISDQSGDMEINVIDHDGEEVSRLTHYGGDDLYPRWSPDGKHVAFISRQEGSPGLYLVGTEGGPATKITSDGNDNILGDWSPNGEWLVYYNEGDEDDRGLWLRNPYGVDVVRLTTGNDHDPAWSPDGKNIAFVRRDDGNSDLFILGKVGNGSWQDGFEVTQLTRHSADDLSPDWSPDARRIAFVSFRTGTAEIYSMLVDGSKQRRLTNNEVDDFAPDWSSDGQQIAFVSSLYGQSEIFVMNADGSRQRRITNNTAEDFSPNW